MELALNTIVIFIILIIVFLVIVTFFVKGYSSESNALTGIGTSAIEIARN